MLHSGVGGGGGGGEGEGGLLGTRHHSLISFSYVCQSRNELIVGFLSTILNGKEIDITPFM